MRRRLEEFANSIFEREKTHIQSFVIQLECVYSSGRFPVIRYDTAHGFAHCDALHLRREAIKTELHMEFNEAFTYSQRDIREQWRFYCERFERWPKEA